MLRMLFATCLVILTMSQEIPNPYNPAPVARAFINVDGAVGSVTVWGGYVNVLLNLTSFNWTKAGATMQDAQAGLAYHIHAKSPANPQGAVGSAGCGGTTTGGHYDPWFACGPATDQTQCISKATPPGSPLSCVNRTKEAYNCTNAHFNANPLTACEVGDWSGKYGKLMPIPNTVIFQFNSASVQNPPSPYEISSVDLYNQKLSVVFHIASSGARILCSPFFPDITNNRSTIANVTGLANATASSTRIVADFTPVGGPMLQFGGGEIGMDVTSALKLTQGKPCGMGQIPFYTLNQFPWNSANFGGRNHATGLDCVNPMKIGGVWDPTVRCPIGSASPYCTNKTMPITTRCFLPFNYTKEALTSQYNSAQGLLFLDASRFPKTIQGLTPLLQNGVFVLPYWLLDTSMLDGWVATITCPNKSLSLCTRLQKVGPNYVSPTTTASPTPPTFASPTSSPVVKGSSVGRALTIFAIAMGWVGVLLV